MLFSAGYCVKVWDLLVLCKGRTPGRPVIRLRVGVGEES